MATILIVDDALFMRKRCGALLAGNGHTIVEAANGREALAIYKEVQPQAVLMDITMPEMDGIEALKAIREFDPSARIAMLTAIGQQSVVLEAIKAGAKDFILKPLDGERVLQSVSRLVA